MAQRIVPSTVVSTVLILILVTSVSARGPAASLQRVARTSIETVDRNPQPDFSGESVVPHWLDELLSRLPDQRVPEVEEPREEQPPDRKTEQIQESLQEGLQKTAGDQNLRFPPPQSIPPLYMSPALEGEGIWTAEGLPVGSDGSPLAYKTVYRPSQEFPNSIVYMALFDMSRLKARLFIGESEPGVYQISHHADREDLSKIVAITNAMWMQQHSRGAGAIFRGQQVYPMVEGMATLVVYRDESVDILEWSDDIPLSLVSDARQLQHLIVKDGKVVDKIVKHGKIADSEIGLGGFLIDNSGRSTMANRDLWFLANRSAFGIRSDGNLVFAMGHHISTKDLARALVLAGCKSAIHGDANIHNIVCNFYFRNEENRIVKRDRLSPEQMKYTMNRYDRGYAKDFFAFYER
jgi:hypothetical protein